MVDFDARGRLFGLAGDVLAWSGRPTYSLTTAAGALGVSVDDVAHAWALLGLKVASPDDVALSRADLDGPATWFQLKPTMGDDGAFGFLRVLGAAMARLAEAESTVVRAGAPDIQMDRTHDELTTAKAYRAHHLSSARTHFEAVLRDTSANVVCGVGFAGLSGFTALTQLLTPAVGGTSRLRGIVHAAQRVQCHGQRGGAQRRWTGGEVHRRRSHVDQFHA